LGGVTYYDINFESKYGFPLKIAAAKGNDQFMRLILENHMIEIQKKDKEGLNAFWVPCRYGHGVCMRILAEHGIDIMNTDCNNYNVLHVACKYMYSNIVEMLVKSRFPLDNKTDNGDTAVAIAAQKGNLKAL
jgi:ankyrin repeat protein